MLSAQFLFGEAINHVQHILLERAVMDDPVAACEQARGIGLLFIAMNLGPGSVIAWANFEQDLMQIRDEPKLREHMQELAQELRNKSGQ